MRFRPHGSRVAQTGSALVEFALVVPLFFLIVFGLVQFGLVFAGYCSAAYASQLAVRYAIVRGADQIFVSPCASSDIATLVAPYMWAAQKNSYTVTTTWSPNNNAGSTVTVAISLTYKTGIPYSVLSTVKVGASSQGTILF
jgi:Flp pilus assembly protein TadG